MKILYLVLLIWTLFISGNLINSSLDNKPIKPINVKTSLTTIVAGTSRTYYPLSINNASLLSIRGPGEIKVITRVRFTSNKSNLLSYKVNYRVDGETVKTIEFKDVLRSKIAVYKSDSLGVPGQEGDIIIKLGGGEHNVKVWLDSENPKVAARYIFTPRTEKKIRWVTLSPINPDEPINLITDEDEVKYFRFSKDKPVKYKISGPTKLRILTRIEYEYKMKGRIDYRLQIKEDSKIMHTYQLNSVRSEITTYKNDNTKIPGKAKEILINVPKGTHIYEIVPLNKDKNTVLGRVLFPRKDIKLEVQK